MDCFLDWRDMVFRMASKKTLSTGEKSYRGRIAPTPSGLLHAGHARTFWIAWRRSRQFKGSLIYRTEDLDHLRCKANFAETALDDMYWLGLSWAEGPDFGGPNEPYVQSARRNRYGTVWRRLLESGHIFPCRRSRKELRVHVEAYGLDTTAPIYPEEWRPQETSFTAEAPGGEVTWRFRVPLGRKVTFQDGCLGEKTFIAGEDFGDFVVWRRDDVPAYELAVVVDDIAMGITEVVRGEDLLLSTSRQILLYEALGGTEPAFYHCPLLLDEEGQKLSKRLDSRSIRDHRANDADAKEWAFVFNKFYRSL